MSAAFAPNAAGRKILDELSDLRPQIDATKSALDALYARQRRLYVRGSKAAVPATEMARALGTSEEQVPSGAEAINQVIREYRKKEAERAAAAEQ